MNAIVISQGDMKFNKKMQLGKKSNLIISVNMVTGVTQSFSSAEISECHLVQTPN